MIPPHPQAPALNFYPRPPRGGRQPGCRPRCRFSKISIHALREEGDESQHHTVAFPLDFYPRPPRGGRRSFWPQYSRYSQFLSTPSARRATGGRSPRHQDQGFLSTPSARRATGLRAGWCFANLFLSTPSARRATTCPPSSRRSARISIHALREEGDRRR